MCAPCEAAERAEREEAERRVYRARWPVVGPVRAYARRLLAAPDGFAVLDTETTGLNDAARIVEIAAYSGTGEKLIDTLVNPGVPIPAAATRIHGIADADVADAPAFGEILPELTRALTGRRIVIYNVEFDTARLAHELDLWHRGATPLLLPLDHWEVHPSATAWMDALEWAPCAMEAYARYYGDWSDYHGSRTWQRLGGGHRAGGDCRTVLTRLQEMADAPDPV